MCCTVSEKTAGDAPVLAEFDAAAASDNVVATGAAVAAAMAGPDAAEDVHVLLQAVAAVLCEGCSCGAPAGRCNTFLSTPSLSAWYFDS